jgi:hypothetical protein
MAEQAYQLIRDPVLHGELEPGTIVSERMLAEQLQFVRCRQECIQGPVSSQVLKI